MIDIKFLRENPEAVKENIRKKFQDEKLPLVDEVIEYDAKARAAQQEADQIRADKKKISKQIGGLMAQGKKEEAMALKDEVAKEAKELKRSNVELSSGTELELEIINPAIRHEDGYYIVSVTRLLQYDVWKSIIDKFEKDTIITVVPTEANL
jgi:seryl-tRNA synthetase